MSVVVDGVVVVVPFVVLVVVVLVEEGLVDKVPFVPVPMFVVPVAPVEPLPFTPVVSVAGVQLAPAQLFVVPGVVDIMPGEAVVLVVVEVGLLAVPTPFVVPIVLALLLPVVFTPVPGVTELGGIVEVVLSVVVDCCVPGTAVVAPIVEVPPTVVFAAPAVPAVPAVPVPAPVPAVVLPVWAAANAVQASANVAVMRNFRMRSDLLLGFGLTDLDVTAFVSEGGIEGCC